MKQDSKIYIAGGTGMVGSSIIKRLLSSGYTNIVSNYYKRKPDLNLNLSSVSFIELDLRRQEDTERFFEKERPEYVFLAAAKVGGILANSTYKADFIYDNIMIASNVIHSAYKYEVKKLLNLGSSCIYPKYAPQPMKEEYLLTGPLEPTNEPYAIAKISAIKLCKYYNEQYGTNFISVMPTNLYGLGDNFNLETAHVLPALIRKFHLAKLLREKKYEEIKKDFQRFPVGFNLNLNLDLDLILSKLGITSEYVMLWGTGEPYREFLYVDDLADACVFLMERYDAMRSAPSSTLAEGIGEFINIGTGDDIKIKDIAKLIKKIVGFDGDIKWDTTKPDGTPRKLLDVSRLKALGWEPKVSLEEGIRRTYEWYVSNYSLQA